MVGRGDDPLLAWRTAYLWAISSAQATLKSWWDTRPNNFLLAEGMDINPDEILLVDPGTPYFWLESGWKTIGPAS